MVNHAQTTRSLATCAAAVVAFALTGCIEQRIFIDSDPPGALVHLNDVDVGRTPVEVDFLYYGVYDIRLDKDGYAPLWTKREAKAPLHAQPPFDLITEALPATIKNEFHWSFKLIPVAVNPDAVIERARAMRASLELAPGPARGQTTGEPRTVGEDQPLPTPVKTPVRERSGVPKPPAGKPASEPPA